MGFKSSFVPEYGDPKDPEVRAKYGYLEAGISILVNLLLFMVKFIMGLLLNSISLIVDSVHTLSDSASSLIVLAGFKAAKKPADEEHPYGHGRAEHIATLFLSFLLMATAAAFLWESIDRLMAKAYLDAEELALPIGVFVLFTAVVKELLARYSHVLGDKIGSKTLYADSWHHRSDALTSVVVGIGIICSNFGYGILDPVLGLALSMLIGYGGYEILKETSDSLMGEGASKELKDKVKELSRGIPGLLNVRDIYIHDYAATQVLTLTLEVDKDVDVQGGHDIADTMENRINRDLGMRCIIHVEPGSMGGDRDRRVVESVLRNILASEENVLSFHKISMVCTGSKMDVHLHIVVKADTPINTCHGLEHRLKDLMMKRTGCYLKVHFEPGKGNRTQCWEDVQDNN